MRNLSYWKTNCRSALWLLLCSVVIAAPGCGSIGKKEKKSEFFTSGSREADQRASQRMARAEQLAGTGEGAGEKKKGILDTEKDSKLALFDRLGGEKGIGLLVDDFLARALQDPRVNWQRLGIKRGGFWIDRNKPVSWIASPDNLGLLKKHMAQFFALATGGPAHYEGRSIRSTHGNLHISNAEFDAAVGDLKASLDKLQVENREQKELLAIVESTRPEIVTER